MTNKVEIGAPTVSEPRAPAAERAFAEPDNQVITVVGPSRGWQLVNVQELWRFRELVFHLIWRDVKVRYKQTLLGGAWAVLQPASQMLVFTIIFNQYARIDTGAIPYPLFVLLGLLPWNFFSAAITQSGNSVVNSEHLITKIYFPRLSIPLSAVGAGIVDFIVAFSLFFIVRAFYHYRLGTPFHWAPENLLAPVIFGVIVLFALGVGTLFSALNVAYRDFRYVIPFVIQLWMYGTLSIFMPPSAYPADVPKAPSTSSVNPSATASGDNNSSAPENTPDEERRKTEIPAGEEAPPRQANPPSGSTFTGALRTVLAFNPMIGLISAFRASLLGGPIDWPQLGFSTGMVVAVFLAGTLYFRRVEDTFPDII